MFIILFINIKKFRISEDAIPTQSGTGRAVIAKIEYFLKSDSLFIPLYRFDSIVHFEGRLNKEGINKSPHIFQKR